MRSESAPYTSRESEATGRHQGWHFTMGKVYQYLIEAEDRRCRIRGAKPFHTNVRVNEATARDGAGTEIGAGVSSSHDYKRFKSLNY